MAATAPPSTPTEVFIASAERDRTLRRALEIQLSLLHRRGLVTLWHEQQIEPGTERAQEIDAHLDAAGVIVLLISPAFVASDYCYDQVLPRALKRHADGQAQVVPVLLRPLDDWEHAAFGHLQPLPANRRAITDWRNRERAFTEVVTGIRQAVEALRGPTVARPPWADSASVGPDTGEATDERRLSIWNVPHRRNPHFAGREDLLTELRRVLTSGQPAAWIQAITGLGGVGKTQIAVEYAYRHSEDYRVIWWVRAEETATLAADYAGLASTLQLPEHAATEQALVVGAVRQWLEGHTNWLLIFNDIQAPENLDTYLPRRPTGHVLITSRNQAWGGRAQPLTVRQLAPTSATAFVLERTGQTDHRAAASLAEDAGDLPLALEQAAAYIETTGLELAEYVQRFRTRQAELLSKGRLAEYPRTVATTWELAFQDLREAAPVAADLLALCAFLAPDAISVELIREAAEYLPAGSALATAVGDDLQWDEAVAALRRYSLVEVSGDLVSVHRLVQAMEREDLGEEARRSWAKAAVQMVNAAFPFDSNEVQTWPTCAQLLSHALVASGHAEALRVGDEATGRLLNDAGAYLHARAQFTEAKPVLERALAIRERLLGPNHLHTATSMNNLGFLLQSQGDLTGARPYYERSLAITERVLGPNHPDTATSLNNFGSLLRASGDLVAARPYYERSLAIRERMLGSDHPETAESLNNLGFLLQAQGDLTGARPYLERALAITERVLGPDHPTTAASLNNLGFLLQDQGDLAGARFYLERALTIFQKCLGPDHQYTVTVRNALKSLDH